MLGRILPYVTPFFGANHLGIKRKCQIRRSVICSSTSVIGDLLSRDNGIVLESEELRSHAGEERGKGDFSSKEQKRRRWRC